MTYNMKILYSILFFMIAARIFGMFTLPLTDTTEARYAHTALIMATSGDWITPYYDLGIPFWGKPPFSFWLQALSVNLFGINDFSSRFPSLLFTLLTMGLIYTYFKKFHSKESGLWAILIYFSFLLTYALCGAVLTDPYLAFATTLSMLSFVMVLKKQENYWGYLFFVGLAIGMLAKGPLAIVLVGGAMFLWILPDFKTRIMKLGALPWLSGVLLFLLISIPWYIIAELKTPGFLEYFIVGEHYKRFVDPGWAGDLYGVAHKKPYGTIWLMWVMATIPWGFVVIASLYKKISLKGNIFTKLKEDSVGSYFVAWSLFAMIFFTVSGNVLWTYILPALPSLAILIAIALEKNSFSIKIFSKNIHYALLLFTPILLLIANIYIIVKPDSIKSDKFLIQYFQSVKQKEKQLYYIYHRPFSAQYYSFDKSILVASKEKIKRKSNSIDYAAFKRKIETLSANPYVVIRNREIYSFKNRFNYKLVQKFKNKEKTLFKLIIAE